ncbi:MAG: hypothetical protein RBT81_08005 [Gammaproteobacteria bacterium]|nr:hypothetical protein [Gammaproteobacteria bacterium]
MSSPDKLLKYEDSWPTDKGLAFAGQRVVYRGADLFSDLLNVRWMTLFLLGITGRRFTDRQIDLFESLWSLSTSYPDPRIWNNRVAALAGTCRSTGALGLSSAIAVSEARIYGFQPIIRAYDFIVQANRMRLQGEDLTLLVLQELKRNRTIAGYARPRINADERIEPLGKRADALGFGGGEHLETAREIERILIAQRYRLRMNVAAMAAALAADQGLSRNEYYQFVLPCFIAGMSPCFMDADDKPAGVFMPLRCDRIQYSGSPRRRWR